MSTGLARRRAVVTGASAGIGAATVRGLAAAGADVAFCARGKEGVAQLVDSTSDLAGRVLGHVADMSEPEQVSAFLDRVCADLGAPDVLINNVGQSPSRNFLHMSDDDWHDLVQVNLMTAVMCTRRLLPAMREQRWGRIVMVASGAAKYPNASLIDYAATKAALVATGKALARKYGRDGVLVNSLLPGLIHTPMWDRAAAEIAASAGTEPADIFDELSGQIPLGRFGTGEEVANVIVFLCSDLASYVSGVALDVDGATGTALF